MEITQERDGGRLHLTVTGRLDGYWADYLARVLDEAIRDGHHHVRLDCAGLEFLSSAGIGVLLKCHKELARINGAFHIVNPSAMVRTTLRLTKLEALLATDAGAAGAAVAVAPDQRLERDGVTFETYSLDPDAVLTCHVLGHSLPRTSAEQAEAVSVSMAGMAPAVAVGVGAFGEQLSECQTRFGELLSVAGATACQPADGTNVPDYLVSVDRPMAGVRMLSGLALSGGFSHLVRFDVTQPGSSTRMSAVIDGCLESAGEDALGLVLLAEAKSLIGAALRRSPLAPMEDRDFFDHPGIRARLAFTAEPAFGGSVVLAAGVVSRAGWPRAATYLRPFGPGLAGHVHGAAFTFRPLTKGLTELSSAVSALFEPDRLQAVLHLLADDRAAAGAGESQVIRGACWIGRLGADWPAAAGD